MPKFDIQFDSDNQQFSFTKDGKMIEGLDEVFMSCFRDCEDNIHYHLSYNTTENNETVTRHNSFKKDKNSKTSPLNVDATVSIDMPNAAGKLMKRLVAAQRLSDSLTSKDK